MTAPWPADLAASVAAALAVPADAVRASDADGTPCLDVPVEAWLPALRHARDGLGCAFFDWLTAVDESDRDPPGLDVVAHVARPPAHGDRSSSAWHLLLRTRVPATQPRVDSATGVYAGAAWHERETAEMFGLDFPGYDDGSGHGLRTLLLPDGFEGTPLRKSFQLAARAAKAWPGAKEPGESHADAASPARRKLLPPGVPDAATWGPRRPAPDPPPPDEGGEPGG